MKKLLLMSALLLIAISVVVLHRPFAQTQYVPRAVFCPTLSNAPCSQLPAYIGPDPALGKGIRGYSGLFGPFPTSAANDVQTPFDNMAWQMFIALNWAASQVKQPPAEGLTTPGPRVYQTYRKVSTLFAIQR